MQRGIESLQPSLGYAGGRQQPGYLLPCMEPGLPRVSSLALQSAYALFCPLPLVLLTSPIHVIHSPPRCLHPFSSPPFRLPPSPPPPTSASLLALLLLPPHRLHPTHATTSTLTPCPSNRMHCRTGISFLSRRDTEDIGGILARNLATPLNGIIVSALAITLIASGHLIWYIERHHNTMFPKGYLDGVDDGIWWSLTTVTTVRPLCRLNALFKRFLLPQTVMSDRWGMAIKVRPIPSSWTGWDRRQDFWVLWSAAG